MALLEHFDGDGAADVDEGVLGVVGQRGAHGAQHHLAELTLSEVRLEEEESAVKLPLPVRLQEEVLALVVLDVVKVAVVVLSPAAAAAARGRRKALSLLDGDVWHNRLLLPLDQHHLRPVVHVPAEHHIVRQCASEDPA